MSAARNGGVANEDRISMPGEGTTTDRDIPLDPAGGRALRAPREVRRHMAPLTQLSARTGGEGRF